MNSSYEPKQLLGDFALRIFFLFIFSFSMNTYASSESPTELTTWFKPDKIKHIEISMLSGEKSAPPNFNGFGMVLSGETENIQLIETLLSLLQSELRSTSSGYSLCFNPRHTLTIKSKSAVYDFMICYECSNLAIYRNSEELLRKNISGASKERLHLVFKHILQGSNE